MAMTWTTLTGAKTVAGSIKNWVNYEKVDSETILDEAQATIFQFLRIREMRASTTLTISVGDSTKALPTGFLDPIDLRSKNMMREIEIRDEATLNARRVYDTDWVLESGFPAIYAIFDELMQFEYKFEEADELPFVYFKRPTLLSVSNTTNFLTDRFPHLLRTACMMQAADMAKDDTEYAKLSTRLVALIEKTNVESDLSYRGMRMSIEGP